MPISSKSASTPRHVRRAENHVVCAVDSHMSYALAILLSSLENTRSAPFRVTIGFLEGTLPESDRTFLMEVCRNLKVTMNFLPLETREVFITQGHISATTFAKFLLADVVEGPLLWIDADTIALPGWDGIFSDILRCTEAEGLVVAARGSNSSKNSSAPSGLAFNAGVLGFPGGAKREWETPLSSLRRVDTQEQFLFNQLYAETAVRVSENYNLLTYRVDSLNSENMPFIIHFAGAHKPWHLRRDLTATCKSHRCPWSEWFKAETDFLAQISGSSLRNDLMGRQQSALSSGKIRLRRDHSGYIFLRSLRSLGPAARLVTLVLRLLKQWFPRGTHPIH